jgi:hypothetical protein
MAHNSAFQPFAPGFDFLQGLVKNAGASMPGMGQWVAPTLDPQELEKRIEELRTVQFWLEQNARMLGATIQALEVQKMTLSTLRTMNVQMGDLREALTPRAPEASPQAAQAPAEAEPAPAPEKPAAAIDPMQWWNALTQQFGELAASAIKDAPAASGAARSAAAPATATGGRTGSAGTRKTPAARKQPAARRTKGTAPKPGKS